MSHQEQFNFFVAVVAANAELVRDGKVLEIGAYDVNGSVRSLFSGAHEYVGVDLNEGPGVDVVSLGHEVDHNDGYYDVAISSECFEHDPHWRETFVNMVRMTRPGGLVAFTCASRGRPEHGTTRSTSALSPGTQFRGIDYYRNLTVDDFSPLPLQSMFSCYRFWYMPLAFDLYFVGIRSGNDTSGRASARQPSTASIEELRTLMPMRHRIVRAPLGLISRFVPDEQYRRLILPYWSAYIAAGTRVAALRTRLGRSTEPEKANSLPAHDPTQQHVARRSDRRRRD